MNQPLPTSPSDLEKNLSDLRRDSFSVVIWLALGICAGWFVLGALRHYIQPHPLGFWIGFGTLLAAALLGLLLRDRALPAAAHLLVWGVLLTVSCLAITYGGAVTATLLVLPVILAGTLLGGVGLGWMTGAVMALSIGLGLWRVGIPLPLVSDASVGGSLTPAQVILRVVSGEFLLPLLVIGLTALAAVVSLHGLTLAVAWVWQGYERARHNEALARNNQADLQRVVKSLENTRYQLERTNYKLTLARNGAEEARRLKQQFVQTISHELRTPLNLIVGFTELMTASPEQYGGALPVAYRRDLSIVYRNASHLQDLVNDVLDLARIESAHLRIVPERTDVAALVREAVETIRSLVEAEGLTLWAEIEPGLPSLWIDPTRIRQVVFNLLSNAARFTEQGGIIVRVRRQESDAGSHVLLTVTDTGPGIAPGDQARIFQEFQQLDGSTRRHHGGVGLGLVICQRFVRLHGGTIWVESELEKGSTFSVRLPVVDRLGVAADADAMASELVELHSPSNGVWQNGRNGHTPMVDEPVLLVVTESPLAVELLSRYINSAHTVFATDLVQAGRLVHQIMPQVIVIDRAVLYAEDCGLATDRTVTDLAKLGESWGLRRTPLLVCPLPDLDPLGQRLDVDGYLFKPISQRSLWSALERFGDGIETVLVIDADQDFVLLISRMLEGSSVRSVSVVEASSGAEGLAMMGHERPDLMLLNVNLPDMSGQELLEKFRAEEPLRRVPVLVISAQEELDPHEQLVGDMILTRPQGFATSEMVQWVQSALEGVMTPSDFPPAPAVANRSTPPEDVAR